MSGRGILRQRPRLLPGPEDAPQMAAKQRYQQALQGLVQYSFLAGKLALTWRDGEGMGALLFASAQPSDAAVPGG